MLSLTAKPPHIAHLQSPTPLFKRFIYPLSHFQLYPTRRLFNYPRVATLLLTGGEKGGKFGCFELKRSEVKEHLMCCRCMREGDIELEEKILEFMENSEKPKQFPTRKELIDCGRLDLVEEIKNRGGWFSLGWEDMESEVGIVEETESVAMESDAEQFKRKQECCGGTDNSFAVEESTEALPSPSSSGRSLEFTNEKERGVEGILSRLQRERDSSLGIDMGRYVHGPQTASMDEGGHWNFKPSTSADRIDPGKTGNVMSGDTKMDPSYDTGSYYSHSTKPDYWKEWSIQHTGTQMTEFEAAEVSYIHVDNENPHSSNTDHIVISQSLSGLKEINQDKIQTRLNQLESELSSALHSLRFVKDGSLPNKGKVSCSSELQKLYDALEFHENEVMHATEKLRVLRSQMAVIEGKRSLLIGEAKNTYMLNQRRLESAQKALQLLRTTSIVWHNSASEVLLTGSYDGWTSQRKMEKSSSGIFCASLRLYPGRYEIKFVVDGIWRVDPLLPIVQNNGYDNNLLVIT